MAKKFLGKLGLKWNSDPSPSTSGLGDGEKRKTTLSSQDAKILEGEFEESLRVYGQNPRKTRRPHRSDLKVEFCSEVGKRVYQFGPEKPSSLAHEEWCETPMGNHPVHINKRDLRKFLKSETQKPEAEPVYLTENCTVNTYVDFSKSEITKERQRKYPSNPLLELQISQLKENHMYLLW